MQRYKQRSWNHIKLWAWNKQNKKWKQQTPTKLTIDECSPHCQCHGMITHHVTTNGSGINLFTSWLCSPATIYRNSGFHYQHVFRLLLTSFARHLTTRHVTQRRYVAPFSVSSWLVGDRRMAQAFVESKRFITINTISIISLNITFVQSFLQDWLHLANSATEYDVLNAVYAFLIVD